MQNSEKDLTAEYFLSSLSHEIRTPLNGIVGYTQLMLQTKLDSTQETYLNSMNRCCLQLVQLINDILDFSKLAMGKMQLHNECFDIQEIVEEVNSALGYRIKEKKQKCHYILNKDLPSYIVADKGKLTQILINLVSNANKFTPINGHIDVSVVSNRNNMLEVSVEDNGIGISEKNQTKLFDAFYQVHQSMTKTGTGLGLSICKKLTELMGGTIQVKSEENKGSVFSFTIQYEPYEIFQKKVEDQGKILRDKYALLVDDNIDNRVIIGEILFEYNMRPIICSTAKETIQMVTNNRYPFAVALIDICMPDMSGTDLAKEIREIQPKLPMIALSSIDEPISSNVFSYVIKKPIDKIRLLDCMTKTVGDDLVDCIIPEKKSRTEVDRTVRTGIRILIAEDVSYNLDMLIKMLRSLGYNDIDTAIDGSEAIQKLDQQYSKGSPYDVLLLDLKMPNIDGFGVAEHMRQRGYVYPKIAVLSASVVDSDRERCKELGIKYFILKPIIMSHLRGVLAYLSNETKANVVEVS